MIQTSPDEAKILNEKFDHARLSGFHTRLVLMTGLSWIWAGMGVGIVGYMIPSIRKEWQIDASQLGLIASFGLAGMMVGSVLAGTLADRYGRRRTLEFVMVWLGVFSLISAAAWNYPVLLGLRLLAGVGIGAVLPVGSTLISEYSPIRYRGRLSVLLNGFFGLGGAAAALVGFWLVPLHGWRFPLIFIGLAALSAPLIRRWLPELLRYLIGRGKIDQARQIAQKIETNGADPAVAPQGASPTRAAPSAAPQGKERPWSPPYLSRTISLWLLWFVLNFTFQGVFVWLPTILVASGMTLSASFLVSLVISLGQIPGCLFAAYFADATSRSRSLAVFMIIWGIAAFFFGQAHSSAAVLSWGFIMAIGNGASWGLAYPFTTELYPTRIRGTATGWATGFGRVGGILAPWVVGLLLQLNAGNTVIFSMLAMVPILATLLLLGLRTKTTGQVLEEITH